MRLTQIFLGRIRDNQFKYFKRWVEKEMHGDQVRVTYNPITGTKHTKKKSWHYNEHRPWTDAFKQENFSGKNPTYYVEPVKDYMIYKGDRVEVLTGKDKGKHGLINCIIKERNWCFIDGLNCEYKMTSLDPGMAPRCSRDERPLLITTQVKLVDPSDNKPCDTVWRFTGDGEEVRISTRTGRIIPIPKIAHELEDGVVPSTYLENKTKDTPEKILQEVTFDPKLLTFEEEIVQEMGIKEDRKPAPTFYY